MKKAVALLLFWVAVLLSLSSCSHIIKFDSCHPINHPMSKWVGDCTDIHMELYVFDDELGEYMVIDYGDKKISYLVWWHQNYFSQMSTRDVRESFIDENQAIWRQDLHLSRDWWDVELIDETHFKLVKRDVQISDIKCDIPELMLPNEVIMTRVETELTSEDIPQLEQDENYIFCPTYHYGTKWISDDNKVSIDGIKGNGTAKVTFAADPNSVYCIGFFEVNSKAYIVKWEEDSLFYFSRYEFRRATEEWQCEYFEDYFVATIRNSEFYEEGHVLTFNLITQDKDTNK